ncbi:MAG TPA: ATP/GTP-binding protein [Caproicibacter sp.]|nr:ATP/GTP-binding protein [Caproicibacter sp.]
MLIRFNVGNFLSFNSTQEFSMIGGKARNKTEHIYNDRNLKLLKFAAIYGANASGKSNLLKAISFARETIINGLPDGHTTKYHKAAIENRNRPSYFEFEIEMKNRYYAYGFEVILNQSKIVSEWLVEILSNNTEKQIFTRDIANKTYSVNQYFDDEKDLKKLDIYASDIKSDDTVLFLKLMNQNKIELYKSNPELVVLQKIYNWIERNLKISFPDQPITDYSYFITDKNHDEINRILAGFGTGITNSSIVKISPEIVATKLPKEIIQEILGNLERKASENKKQDLKMHTAAGVRVDKDFFIFEIDKDDKIIYRTIAFNHNRSDIQFSLSEESDGTIRMLDLIEILLNRNNEQTYFIDEIDRCLHPQLTYKFIETYLRFAEKSNIQLVVTTHESRLLDFELLRRDEIWFINKDKKGESSVYSLEEYNTRFDQKIDKAYLEGRYGGVPIFDAVFPVKGE